LMFPAIFSDQQPRKSITLRAWHSLTLEVAFPEENAATMKAASVYLYVEVNQQKYDGVHLSLSAHKVDATDPANDVYGPVSTLYKNNTSQDVTIDLVTESDSTTEYTLQVELEEEYIVPTPLNTGLTKAHKKIEYGAFGQQFEIERDNHLSAFEIKHLPEQYTGIVRLEFYHNDDAIELPLSKNNHRLDLSTAVTNYQDIHLLTLELKPDQIDAEMDGKEITLHFAYQKEEVKHH
ncbi:MAG: hypothetical protein JWO58_2851, partial [Chitinophagaceae bacterium]|nr:hypothetical protein [Chitinophagaceae bacterium]